MRRALEVALSYGEVDRVAGLPDPVDLRGEARPGLLPARRGHTTRELAEDVDAGGLTEPEALGPVLERLALAGEEHVAHMVEVRVARLGDGSGEVERAVPVLGPAAELGLLRGVVALGLVPSRAPDRRAGVDHALLEGGDGSDGLEGGAHRLGLGDGAVDLRVVLTLPDEEALVLLLADAADPDRGVVGRVAGHRQDLAVAHVEHHGGAAVGVVLPVPVRQRDPLDEGVLRGLLHLGVERRDQSVARFGQTPAGHLPALLGVPLRVDLDLGDPVAAAQPRVVGPLQAVVADDVTALVALEVPGLELLGRDGADVTQDVRREVAVGVGAQVLVADLHTRIRGCVLLDVGPDALADVLLQRDQVYAGDLAVHDVLPRQEALPPFLRDRAVRRRRGVPAGVSLQPDLEVGGVRDGGDGEQPVVGLGREARDLGHRPYLGCAGQRLGGGDVDGLGCVGGALGGDDLRFVGLVAHGHGVELHGARLEVVGDGVAQLADLHLQMGGEPLELLVERALRHVHEADADVLAAAVLHDDLAVTVDDVAPRGGDRDGLEAVVVGLGDELLAAQDLQEPQAEEDDAEHRQGDPHDHRHAQRDGGQLDDGLVAAAGADGPVTPRRVITEQRHAGLPFP